MRSFLKLPDTLNIGGVDYKIRTNYEDIIELLIALNDPEFKKESKEVYSYIQTQLTLEIMFPDYKKIPQEHIYEALTKAYEFIDMGNSSSDKNIVKIMDWEIDSAYYIPPINKVLGYEIRDTNKNTHWWTFLGAYMEIGESIYSTIINIRNKKSKKIKLEKWEEEFYRENKSLINFKSENPRNEEEKNLIRNYLYGHKNK